MKTLISLTFLIIFGFTAKAQDIYFLNDSQKELVKGKIYLIQVRNNTNLEEEYKLESNNGTIKDNKFGNYEIQPNKKGILTIKIKNIKGLVINQKNFRVRETIFKAYIMDFEKTISVTDIKRFSSSFGLDMYSDDLICSDILHTGKYEIAIIKNNNTVYKTISYNLNWNDEIRENFRNLENGNIVLIYNINFIIGKDIYEADPILLEVKL
jgi:hypothetical protein